jgi:3-hydroxyisobutyrate dehydrogenase
MKVAFLGLGRMGRELATHLLNSPHELTVWNRTPGAADDLVSRGAKTAPTAAAAVKDADVVLTAFFGPDAVFEVVVDPELPIRKGALWIDITTVGPVDAYSFAKWAHGRGLRYAQSPVIGSLGPARAGKLAVLLGGAPDEVEAARPIVSLWADPEKLRVYATPIKAAAGKLIANLAIAVSMQGVVEALRLGRSTGLGTEEVLAALDPTALVLIKNLKAENIRTGDFEDTQFSADLLHKDVRTMLHTSQFPLPALTAAFDSLEKARRADRGDDDFSVIAEEDGGY